jgi:hypothetical protein
MLFDHFLCCDVLGGNICALLTIGQERGILYVFLYAVHRNFLEYIACTELITLKVKRKNQTRNSIDIFNINHQHDSNELRI